MTILTATDSTLERMEPRLAARLGVPVEDGSVGGDRVNEVLARTERNGRGKQLLIRCGHNIELRRGEIETILDAIRKIATVGSDYLVCELGMTSEIADPQSAEAVRLRGYRDEVCRRLVAEHGDRYVPLHQLLLAEARQGNLTPTDAYWVSVGMLPTGWWAPFGTNGHYSDPCRDVAADKLAPYMRWRFLGGPKPGNVPTPPPGEPPVEPPAPPAEPSNPLAALLAALRRLIRRRRP